MDNYRALENCGATRSEIFNLLLAVNRLVDDKPQFLTQGLNAHFLCLLHCR